MNLYMAPLTRLRSQMPGSIPTPLMATYYSQRAGDKGASVLLTEATDISETAGGYYAAPGIYTDEQEDGWREVVSQVHSKGSQIWCQLWHVGRVSHFSLQPNGAQPVSSTSKPCPHRVPVDSSMTRVHCSPPRPLGEEEIPNLIDDYVNAALRAKRAGFDGIQIHGANGYLLEQFLRSEINDRNDKYGGSLKNRLRLCLEVTKSICEVWNPNNVSYRMSPIYGDVTKDRGDKDMLETYGSLAKELAEMNLAFVDVVESFTVGQREEGLDVICQEIRKYFNGIDGIKKYIAGGGFTWEEAKKALKSNRCDAIMFGRLFISNPDLSYRLENNLDLEVPDTSTFYGGTSKGYTDYPFIED